MIERVFRGTVLEQLKETVVDFVNDELDKGNLMSRISSTKQDGEHIITVFMHNPYSTYKEKRA